MCWSRQREWKPIKPADIPVWFQLRWRNENWRLKIGFLRRGWMTIVHPLFHIFWYARQDSNPPERISAAPQPAVYGFEVQESRNSKRSWFQLIESIQLFKLTFGFVWNCLEIFDLDGHILGTVLFPLNSYLQPSFSSGSLKIGKKIIPLLYTKCLGFLLIIALVENE